MDILRPPLVWIEGRCYRKNTETEYTVSKGYTGEDENELAGDLVGRGEEEEEEVVADIPRPIETAPGGGLRVRLPVAAAFFPQIIGKGGQIKVRLERDTRTKISIPGKGQDGDIVITGRDRRGLITACNRIDVMVGAARNRQDFTHFISLPVNSPELQASFQQFKSQVLETCSHCRGVEESIFQTSSLLHLTVGTLALLDERERAQARDILQDCKEHILLPLVGENPFKVTVEGLEIMNDDPSEVDVLYAKISQSADLQTVADKIVERFVESGLMRREYDHVKFHVTLMNTLFRKDKTDVGDKSESKSKDRESFDSREILQCFGSHRFGEVSISEIHLSQRRAGRRTPQGYYLPSAILNIVSCG